MNAMKRRGVTLTDLVVVLVVALLLLAMAGNSVHNGRSTSSRVRCASNLMRIGQAILLYSNENKGNYPRTNYKSGSAPTQYTGASAPVFHAPGGPADNDVTAAIYMLLRTQDIESYNFVCPSTSLTPLKVQLGAVTGSNFPGPQNLAYSYANPYPNTTAVNAGYRMNSTVGAEFAVAADMNPGGGVLPTLTLQSPMTQMSRGNTKNHGGMGQNVLYGDGHIEWQQTPFCGQKRDCIYTVSGSSDGSNPNGPAIEGSPRWNGDSVMLPVATIDPGYVGPVQVVTYVVIGVVVVGGIIGVVLWLLLRKKKSPVPAYATMPAPVSSPANDALAEQLAAMKPRRGPPPLPPQE